RPDIDNIFMTAVQVLGRHGGWPLNMFLTPDGRPFFGGTYWPPDDREVEGQTIRGFKSVLQLVHEFQRGHPKELDEQAGKVADRTTAALTSADRGAPLVDLDRDLVNESVKGLQDEFDKAFGGFGDPDVNFKGTKFPTPPYLSLLQTVNARMKSDELT